MSSSKYKFLIDENVRADLGAFLREHGYDISVAQKGVSDSILAKLSSEKKKIFVTNDQDFITYSKDGIWSVVWLRVPQHDPSVLLNAFQNLLEHSPKFQGNLIILRPNKFEISPLPD